MRELEKGSAPKGYSRGCSVGHGGGCLFKKRPCLKHRSAITEALAPTLLLNKSRSVAALPSVPLWAAGAVAVYSALIVLNVFWLGLLLRIVARRAASGHSSAAGLQQQPSLKLDQPPASFTAMGSSVAGGDSLLSYASNITRAIPLRPRGAPQY